MSRLFERSLSPERATTSSGDLPRGRQPRHEPQPLVVRPDDCRKVPLRAGTPISRTAAVTATATPSSLGSSSDGLGLNAVDGLRGERDSLVAACKRLKAEQEKASAELRAGEERARELEETMSALETEKGVLANRCRQLASDVERCASGKCPPGAARLLRLEAQCAKLEEERDEAKKLVRWILYTLFAVGWSRRCDGGLDS